ncbi:MAG: MOSC domain-containing protein, partial [Verrucomicrobiota bacterium]
MNSPAAIPETGTDARPGTPRLVHLFLARGHRYVGRHGLEPAPFDMEEVAEFHCVAGAGIACDRFFAHRPDYKGQITFFAGETWEDLVRGLLPGIPAPAPSVFRRNAITRGVDLNALIGREFTWQGVRLEGVEECRPCRWMNVAFGP